jgi:hypothetical protein
MDYNANINDFDDYISNWNIYKIINYIKVNYIQFLLLILVGIIVYVIDHISNINAVLFGMPSSLPGINTQVKPVQIIKQEKNKKSKK